MSKSKSVTVGYKYYLGMHLVLCHGPVDAITAIEVDDKQAWSGTATGGTITINAENLFGGEEREGGIKGEVDVLMGSTTQPTNSYLLSKLGPNIPAFRGVVSVVLKRVYLGINPYLKSWSFWATRRNTRLDGQPQWYPSKVAIGNDMNPAHIIRECLTDSSWGMGYPEADIDDASFTAAANSLHSEGMGISILWDKSVPLNEFITEVLKHIDASLYVDRSTGRFTLKLVRGGYDVSSLLVLNENNISKISDFRRSAVGELTNSVTVSYWDGETGKENSVTVQDIALVDQQGATVGTTVQFQGFTTGANAMSAASRTLRQLSTPLASCTIYTNRAAANLNVGDVFVLEWPLYGVVQLVMRVSNIEFGSLDNNEIRITAVEDVFGSVSSVYAPPPPSAWVSPVSAPAPCPHHILMEAPYWEVFQRTGEVEAQKLPTTSTYIVATGVRPSSDAITARLYTDPGNSGTYVEANLVDFCPTATLGSATGFNDTVWPIASGIDLDSVRIGSYAVVDNEFVVVQALSDSAMTVLRGTLDTIPAAHSSGARIFFFEDFCETDGVDYAPGETARVKILPTTGKGTLGLGSAPVQSRTLLGRQARPYPPQRLRINGTAYPVSVSRGGDITVSWAHRDRLQQTVALVGTDTASIGPEPGTTYNVRFYDGDTGTLRSEILGVTGDSATHVIGPTVLLLNMNGADGGTIFTDEAGNTVNRFGAVTRTAQSKFGGASGYFDGVDDYLSLGPAHSWVMGVNYTCEAFAYPLSTPTAGDTNPDYILRKVGQLASDYTSGYVLALKWDTAAGKAVFFFSMGSGGTEVVLSGTTGVVPGQWYHVAVSKTGSAIRLFVNGVLQASSTAAPSDSPAGQLYIGRDPQHSTRFWHGYIDSFRIVNGTSVYTSSSNFTPPTAEFSKLVPSGPGSIKITLESSRDGLLSLQRHEYTVAVV